MSDSEASTPKQRQNQRYKDGFRLVAGCIPFKYKNSDNGDRSQQVVEVLMINSHSALDKLVFPKGGWEIGETIENAAIREAVEEAGVTGVVIKNPIGEYEFESKRHQNQYCPEGKCKATVYALVVKEELGSWPEEASRCRSWLSIPEACERCCRDWMKDALKKFEQHNQQVVKHNSSKDQG